MSIGGPGATAESIARAIQIFRGAKKENPEVVLFTERTMNLFAFRLQQQKKPNGAIELLKLNVEAYPRSTAAMNNLGNAYGDAGRKELAIECFEKAMNLIATDPAMSESEKEQSRQVIERKLSALKQQ